MLRNKKVIGENTEQDQMTPKLLFIYLDGECEIYVEDNVIVVVGVSENVQKLERQFIDNELGIAERAVKEN